MAWISFLCFSMIDLQVLILGNGAYGMDFFFMFLNDQLTGAYFGERSLWHEFLFYVSQ